MTHDSSSDTSNTCIRVPFIMHFESYGVRCLRSAGQNLYAFLPALLISVDVLSFFFARDSIIIML